MRVEFSFCDCLAWPAIKNISIWNANDLDLILCEGTKLYGGLGYTNFANRVLPIILVNRSDFTYQQNISSCTASCFNIIQSTFLD